MKEESAAGAFINNGRGTETSAKKQSQYVRMNGYE